MSFLNRKVQINFSVKDIENYSYALNNAKKQADELTSKMMETLKKIEKALSKLLEIGKNNLTVCNEQLEYCENLKPAFPEKENALYNAIKQIESQIFQLDNYTANAKIAYKNACADLNRIKHASASTDAEKRALAQARSVMQQNVAQAEYECAMLEDKRNRLFNIKNQVFAKISDLNEINLQFNSLCNELEMDKDKLECAIVEIEEFIEKIQECKQDLFVSHLDNVEEPCVYCSRAVKKAIDCGVQAYSHMTELTETDFSDDMYITVTDLNALRAQTEYFANRLINIKRLMAKIKEDTAEYGKLVGDDISIETLEFRESLAHLENKFLQNMQAKTNGLNMFCDTLDEYIKIICR